MKTAAVAKALAQAKVLAEVKAWKMLVRRHRFTAEEARRTIGVSSREARDIAPR